MPLQVYLPRRQKTNEKYRRHVPALLRGHASFDALRRGHGRRGPSPAGEDVRAATRSVENVRTPRRAWVREERLLLGRDRLSQGAHHTGNDVAVDELLAEPPLVAVRLAERLERLAAPV